MGRQGPRLDEEGGQEAEESSHAHDAFAAQIEDARTLIEVLAKGRHQQGYGEGNAQGENVVNHASGIHGWPPVFAGQGVFAVLQRQKNLANRSSV